MISINASLAIYEKTCYNNKKECHMQDVSYLISCAQEMGINLTQNQAEKFSEFFDRVVSCNKKFNLTAITDEKDFVVKHIIDSIAGISEIPNGASICDIGAGAGFPSMPIAITRQDVSVVAMDSTEKKMDFLRLCAEQLNVNNLQTVAGRAEEQKDLFSKFDVVTARAVSSLQILLELAMPLLKKGGLFIAYKTDESELPLCENAMKVLNAKHKKTKSFVLPNGDRRAILVFEKTAPTPKQYPRQYGAIKKKPL